MKTYIYKVADIYKINSKEYYFKRKYRAESFINQQNKEREEEMYRLSLRQGINLLDSEYACYRIVETIKTED